MDMDAEREKVERILGITRCAQCGHRLDGEVDCPFCLAMKGFSDDRTRLPGRRTGLSLWVYMTATLLTFPLSLPWLIKSKKLARTHKAAFGAVCTLWLVMLGLWFV